MTKNWSNYPDTLLECNYRGTSRLKTGGFPLRLSKHLPEIREPEASREHHVPEGRRLVGFREQPEPVRAGDDNGIGREGFADRRPVAAVVEDLLRGQGAVGEPPDVALEFFGFERAGVVLEETVDLPPFQGEAEGVPVSGVDEGHPGLCHAPDLRVAERPDEGDGAGVGDERARRLVPDGLHPGHVGERRVGGEREDIPAAGVQPLLHQFEPVDAVAPVRRVAVILDRYGNVLWVVHAEEGERLPYFLLHVVGGADDHRVPRWGGADLDSKRPHPFRVVVEGRGGLRRGVDGKVAGEVFAYRTGVRAAAHQVSVQEDREPGAGGLPDLLRRHHGRGGEDQFDAVLDRSAGLVDQDVLGAPADVDGKE